jgi:hypothetical protein
MKRKCRVAGTLWGVAAGAVIAGCSATPRPIAPDGPVSLDECLGDGRLIPDPMFSDPGGQGSDLLGVGLTEATGVFARIDQFDSSHVVDATGAPVSNLTIEQRALAGKVQRGSSQVPITGTDWNGAVFTGRVRCPNPAIRGRPITTYPIRVKIAEVIKKAASTTQFPDPEMGWAYRLEIELRPGRPQNACRDATDIAFPIDGLWDDQANYRRDAGKLSFACFQRDVAKCIWAGYRDDPRSGDRRVLFEACTRMMRADYCGNGFSYTVDGTMISRWDNRDVAVPHPFEGASFEAAWTPKGVMCFDHYRWPLASLPGHPSRPRPSCMLDGSAPACSSAAAATTTDPVVFSMSCPDKPCLVPVAVVAPAAPVAEPAATKARAGAARQQLPGYGR